MNGREKLIECFEKQTKDREVMLEKDIESLRGRTYDNQPYEVGQHLAFMLINQVEENQHNPEMAAMQLNTLMYPKQLNQISNEFEVLGTSCDNTYPIVKRINKNA